MPRPRDNPFATRRLDGLAYRLEGSTWEELLNRLEAAGGRGALVGPHGRGKTALLEALAPRLEARGYRPLFFRADPDVQLPEEIRSHHAVLLDCGELLGLWAWWRFRRAVRRAGVLVTTLHRPGRLPTLYACRSSPELLQELAEELLGRPAPELLDVTRTLYARNRGNLRQCLLDLYDRFTKTKSL